MESREKENLFPPSVYLLLCQECTDLLTTLNKFIDNEKIIKYFDIKDGVKYKKYKICGWKQYYKSVIEEFEKTGAYRLPIEGDDLDKFICIKGIGDKMCDIACQALLGEE